MVWLITVGAVLLIYILYTLLVGSPEIRIDQDQGPAVDIEVPQFGAQTGETKVGNVEKARFTVLDEETKKLKRVFGFDKLLNPDQVDEKWKLERPYMDIYDDKFLCKITSLRGVVQVETIAGKYTPTNAELYDDVQIKIHPIGDSKMVESTIYLDTLIYNSERSEYSTDGPVRIVSEEGTLEGKGLLLIYNNELTRIEFLRIFELDFLKLKNISKMSSPAEAPPESPAPKPVQTSAAVEVKPQIPSDEPKPKPIKTATPDVQPATTAPLAEETEKPDLYKCQFDKEVVIEYGAEFVATGAKYIAINNILWSDSSEDKKADEAPVVTEEVPSVTDEAPAVTVAPKSSPSITQTQTPSQPKPQVKKPDVPKEPSAPQSSTEVVVTCRGGLVLRPKDSLIGTNVTAGFVRTGLRGEAGSAFNPNAVDEEDKPDLYAKYTSRLTLDPDLTEDFDFTTPPSLFCADSIDYDMTTGNAVAAGPVNFKFYPEVDSTEEFSVGPVPSLITADENTEFFADENRTVNRIVFNGNVIGARNTLTPSYLQKNRFFGQQLIVDLKPARDSSGTDIEHVTVKEGKVKLVSKRMVHDLTINHVQLTCTQLDYSVDDDLVIATGPGDIQINNEHAPAMEKDTGSKLSLKKPCFALVYGYDKLKWFISQNRITADGKANSVNISYLPIVDGERGKIVRVSTSHLQADFIETISGQTELATLNTTGGIHYEEQGGMEFIGDKLFFNVADSMMTISGSEERLCYVNGALVPGIQYNLETGKVKTKLSTSPGIISLP